MEDYKRLLGSDYRAMLVQKHRFCKIILRNLCFIMTLFLYLYKLRELSYAQ